MKQFIYNNYTKITVISFVMALISIYVINNYKTGFLGGFISGICSALAIGLLITPKRNFLK